MKKVHINPKAARSSQGGMTLIVVLVILVAMTFLGLGSMSDSNMQVALVRNTQFENMAYTASMTEINAQIDVINDPNQANIFNDPPILAAVQADPAPITTDDPRMPALLPNILSAAVTDEITQGMTFIQTGITNVPGQSASGAPIVYRAFEYNSVITIDNTNLGSDQVQGVIYAAAAPQS